MQRACLCVIYATRMGIQAECARAGFIHRGYSGAALLLLRFRELPVSPPGHGWRWPRGARRDTIVSQSRDAARVDCMCTRETRQYKAHLYRLPPCLCVHIPAVISPLSLSLSFYHPRAGRFICPRLSEDVADFRAIVNQFRILDNAALIDR